LVGLEMEAIILDSKSTLVGKDLSNVYRHFKKSPSTDLPAEISTKFKKKEQLETMAKSVLKHRIKALTGKSTQEMEEEIGHTSPDDSGFSVHELRKMAHLLIRAAADKLPPLPASPPKPTAGRKRPSEPDEDDEAEGGDAPGAKRSKDVNGGVVEEAAAAANTRKAVTRKTRKSLAPEMLRRQQDEKVDCRLKKQAAADDESIAAKKEEEEKKELDDLNLGPNPTPQMIARKRRSIATASLAPLKPSKKNAAVADASPAVSEVKVKKAAVRSKVKAVAEPEPPVFEEKEEEEEEEEPVVTRSPKKSPKKRAAAAAAEPKATNAAAVKKQPRKSMAMAVIDTLVKPIVDAAASAVAAPPPPPPPPRELKMGFGGEAGCQIYVGQSELSSLKLDMFRSKVKEFPGANMVVLHTPVAWDPPDVFSMVMAVKHMNRTCQLSTFTILVGCGLTNVHLFREALYRQTKHVQFLVFDRNDADLDHDKGKLRNVNSYFLLAYFFEGCQSESGNVEIPPMVRPGATTCFRTESAEDLENQIVHTFTEKGDWVLDLFCGDRELSLAAQKSGRNAIALHNRKEPLETLKEKAAAIAAHYDQDFMPEQDGMILQF